MSRNRAAAPQKDPVSGTWWFVVDIGDGPDGKRGQAKRRGFRTRKAAQDELDRLRGAVRTSSYVTPKRETIQEFLEATWLPAVRTALATSTWESYARNIRVHVVPRIGGLQLQRVDGGVLNRLYSDLLEGGRRLGQQSPGLRPRTVRYIHTILSGAFDDAVKWQRLVVNPGDPSHSAVGLRVEGTGDADLDRTPGPALPRAVRE